MLARLNEDMKTAMKAGERRRVDTIRLMVSALKDREIKMRGQGKALDDPDALAVLNKMTKTRTESLGIYERAGRVDLAKVEAEEIEVIAGYLPEQMSEAEVAEAVDEAVRETGASSIRDMGRVVGSLKARYAGRMDFAKASADVKARLSA